MAYRRLLFAAAVLCAALTVPAPAWASPSLAQAPDCSERLYDPAGRLAPSSARQASLDNVIDALISQGAQVRVRVYDTPTRGGIDQQESADERHCPSWLDDGKRQPTLLVVAVSIDERQTGIYYGSDYDKALDGSWRDIQDQKMNPEFAAGHYAAGLDIGLHAIQKRIEAAPPPHHGVSFAFLGVAALLLGTPVALVIISLVRSRRRTGLGAVYTGGSSAASNFSSSGSYGGDSGSSSSGGGGGDSGGGSSSW
ncbi:MAG: TPM domain-containing protein [Actinocatenispora sp.]